MSSRPWLGGLAEPRPGGLTWAALREDPAAAERAPGKRGACPRGSLEGSLGLKPAWPGDGPRLRLQQLLLVIIIIIIFFFFFIFIFISILFILLIHESSSSTSQEHNRDDL